MCHVYVSKELDLDFEQNTCPSSFGLLEIFDATSLISIWETKSYEIVWYGYAVFAIINELLTSELVNGGGGGGGVHRRKRGQRSKIEPQVL